MLPVHWSGSLQSETPLFGGWTSSSSVRVAAVTACARACRPRSRVLSGRRRPPPSAGSAMPRPRWSGPCGLALASGARPCCRLCSTATQKPQPRRRPTAAAAPAPGGSYRDGLCCNSRYRPAGGCAAWTPCTPGACLKVCAQACRLARMHIKALERVVSVSVREVVSWCICRYLDTGALGALLWP